MNKPIWIADEYEEFCEFSLQRLNQKSSSETDGSLETMRDLVKYFWNMGNVFLFDKVSLVREFIISNFL